MMPSFRVSMKNFWSSKLPMAERIRVALRNNAIKARTRQECCGNHGEPGC
jgi:hypothetical protein